ILTSTNDQEILETLELLKESSADTGLTHESFYYNDPNNYTRSCWANSLFGETILHLAKEKPDLIMIDDFKFIKLLDASK
ncbi:19471_t:CDS:2, partial [Rhizophagus irregularis]